MISEIRVATVGVDDLDRSRHFYQQAFDYTVLASGRVSGPELTELWQMPEPMSAEVLVMGPAGATSGLLRLVRFDVPGAPYWGDYSSKQDYGHYALNIRVPEIRAAMTAIRGNGGRAKSEPTHWTVAPDLSAWDSLSFDPDGVILDVFELEPAPGSLMSEYDGRPSPLQTVAIHCSDARRTAMFFAAMGYRPFYDKMLEGMEGFFRIPEGTDLHNINMMHPDAPDTGRLEIAQYVGWPGRSQRSTAVPPAHGILSVSLASDDLSATESLMHTIGIEPVGERVRFDMPGLGEIEARSYFGLDGEVLELFQCG